MQGKLGGGFWNRELGAALRLLGVAAHASSLQKRKLVGWKSPAWCFAEQLGEVWVWLEQLAVLRASPHPGVSWQPAVGSKHVEVVPYSCAGQAWFAPEIRTLNSPRFRAWLKKSNFLLPGLANRALLFA